MRDTAKDIVDFLAAAGLGLTAGTDLFVGLMPEGPDPCVAVIATGGPQPTAFLSGGTSSLRYPTCQVAIRGKPNDADPQGGHTLAGQVLDALEMADVPPYVWCRVRESAPFRLPDDGNRRPWWVFNVELAYLHTQP